MCERRMVNGVAGVFCSTQGSQLVEGTMCQIHWVILLPSAGVVTTSQYSCRPDTMKLDVSFSSCIAPSLTLRASMSGPAVNLTERLLDDESFNSIAERGILLQDEHTYFSWIPHANDLQMPVMARTSGSGEMAFTITTHISIRRGTQNRQPHWELRSGLTSL